MWHVVAGILTASVVLASIHQYAERLAKGGSSPGNTKPPLLDKPDLSSQGSAKQTVFNADIWRKLARKAKK
jgi:hypothetical protein